VRGVLKRAVAATIIALATLAHAADIRVGDPLPPLRIAELGECVIRGEEAVFEPWDSNRLQGKLALVEYVAARAGVARIHEPLYDEIEKARFPPGALAVTKLVNSDDALWGTSGMVASKVVENKKTFPENSLVVDANGIGLRRWRLREGTGAVALLDRSGEVLFFKEGGPTEDEIRAIVTLITERLP
jgi:uncharacterized protein